MKRETLLFLFIAGIVFACLAFDNTKEKKQGSMKGFALIELFSSEGCSSCPPAEAVMSKIIHKANAKPLPIYVIEFHVDYWDYLGWKDTFAMHMYSQRQQDYGDFFKLNSIYTPQAIVNGKAEMVGSDEDKINATITEEMQKPALVNIACKAYKTGNSNIEVEYSITGNISNCELNIALVESDLTTYVKKGENARRTLTHDNVARVFKSIRLNSDAGEIALEAPHVTISHAKVICYVQNIENRNITGATQISISQKD